jgi:spoIIIJ-associated protein
VSEDLDDVVEPAVEDAAAVEAAGADTVGEDTADEDAAGEDTADGDTADGDTADEAPRSKKETALENEGEIAADYLEELLDIADLDGDIDTFIEGGRAHVSILTDGDMLIGKDGEVLEALQELARLAVMTETGHRSRLMLDIGGHRDKRRKVLQELAADAVAEVNDTGDPVRLAPMNPFERKIVHDTVAAAGLVSESEGEEPQRRVVVLPKA